MKRVFALTIQLLLIMSMLVPQTLLPAIASAEGSTLYSRTITINAGQVPSAQTDFPLLVSLSDATLMSVSNGGHVANADGSDIYFTNSGNTTQYAYEIESYDSVNGTLVAWVKVPSLCSGAVIRMWYGIASSTPNTPSDVWDSNFKGVWHMNQTDALDSTSNGNNGTVVNGSISSSSGKIDGADVFANSPASGYVDCGNGSSLNFDHTASYTLSAWVDTTSASGANGGQGVLGKSADGVGGYEVFLKNTTNALSIQDGAGSGSGSGPTASPTNPSANTWQQVAVVYNNGNVSFYLQGAPDGTGSFGTALNDDSVGNFHIGFRRNYNNGNGMFNGSIDEVRYSTAVRSADWILTEYRNQNAPGSFYTVGTEESGIPVVDVLFDGTVTLAEGETFIVQAANNVSGTYTVNCTTPLGALFSATTVPAITVNVTDKKFSDLGILMVNDIGTYLYNKSTSLAWICQVNGVTLDDYGAPATDGLNIKQLSDGDQVDFYYGTKPVTAENATAVVRITVSIGGTPIPTPTPTETPTSTPTPIPTPVVDVLFDGTVTLAEGETFIVQAANNVSGTYAVNCTTPLGALFSATTVPAITVNVTDKKFSDLGILMVNDIGTYLYNKSASKTWICQVNGVTLDDYGAPATDGLNIKQLSDGDQVDFYYGTKPVTAENATAVVRITVNIGGTEPSDDWTISLIGAQNASVNKSYFEQGIACTHQVSWTDEYGSVWGGMPLWQLVAMVDDDPDVGTAHFNFNDDLAAQGYSVNVIGGDGWSTTLASADIARNDNYIVANTLNGSALPINTSSSKPCWPLHLKGAAVFGGQQVGNITSIELTGLPEPPTEWALTLEGDVNDSVTQSYFEQAIICHHNVSYTDSTGGVWNGVPLWDLVGAVDDIETSSHWTFNDSRVALGYVVRVIAGDGFNRSFSSAIVSHNNSYIVANTLNGSPLVTAKGYVLRLVGAGVTKTDGSLGGTAVSNVSIIRLENASLYPSSYPAGNYSLFLNGKISDVIPQSELEYWIACHSATYTDSSGNVYNGIPLWRLMGWVDDRIPHGSNGFNDAAASAGYKVIVKASDGYSKTFTSNQIGKNDSFIVANTLNGSALPTDGSHPPYPLRLVGTGATGGKSVGNIVEIQLTDFRTVLPASDLHIIKYAADGVTVINETTVSYSWMEANLPVIGDGTTVYKFESITSNASDVWDADETYPGGFKIENAVKGTRIMDLCELVGGMGSGTEITLAASDGYETILPYSSIYTNPAVQARQGDAILAWWGDGKYIPYYEDGMRVFFMPDDHVYGQWDMHETLASNYWHYYWGGGVQYASCAGLSGKYITTIKIYSTPEADWTLELDGSGIGGLKYNVSKTYFEQALACQFGSNHNASYTDSKGRVWEGMALWFLAGFVDDSDQHSSNAFNGSLALAGYNVVITATDGYSTTIDSRNIIRNTNYIVANSLNGSHIADTDENWPLRLAGANVSGGSTVKGVASIRLVYDGDLNGDGQYNILDIVLICDHWGETGTPGWIPEDIHSDGDINIMDIVIVCDHWTS